ncbi:MAG: regulatory protein RecX [Phycisphaerales bacterium]|jgi:regulatory protein|nr:regulatory protein RecX [Phycisphaerales bacterium]
MNTCITAIEADSKDPNMRHIYIDRTCVATLSVSAIETFHVSVGQPWTKELDEQVASFKAAQHVRSIALQLLSRRAWSTQELLQRLIKRGCEAETAGTITQQLAEDGWLDDLSYASACIREWIRTEPASRRFLELKLGTKGIEGDIAARAIEEELSGQCEQDAATELATIRLAKVLTLDEQTKRRRVIAALQRRGFSSDVASEAFRRAT